MSTKIIYLDHAATTPVDPEVLKAMQPFFTELFYNPSSLYSSARDCADAVNHARETVAKWLNAADPSEIIFTGGGSESDNLAIYGICMANREKGNHIITIPIEHHAVLHTVEGMKEHGFNYTIVPVDKSGIVDLEALENAIRDDTVLITIMAANNEIGTIQPLAEIGRIAKKRGVFFHTDAVQAIGSVPIDVQSMNIDALSMSAHKFYGPKGAGVLYLRKGIEIEPLIKGGAQERGIRAGTHNTPGIVGLAKAMDIACRNLEENDKRISYLRDKLITGIMESIPDTYLNGHPEKRLANNANFSFKYIESEGILLHLDMMGVCASSGSACTTGSEDPSHVLAAIGIRPEIARGSIRFTLGKENTEEDVDYVVKNMINIVDRLRKMSPLLQ